MTYGGTGFSVVAQIGGALTLDLVRDLIRATDRPYKRPPIEGGRVEALSHKVVEEGEGIICAYSGPPFSYVSMAIVPMTGRVPHAVAYSGPVGSTFLELSFSAHSMSPPVVEVVLPLVLDRFRVAIDVLKPEFALVDWFGRNVFKPAKFNVDLRAFAWGATVYGPGLVKLVGVDRLRSAPAFKVEELPWGGVWLQVAENPFFAKPVEKRAVERHLDLAALFPGPGGVQMHRNPKADDSEENAVDDE